jgi:[NiFe] hydrogenase diaphorase moiety small subunit
MSHTFTLDGKAVPFVEGQTIMQAASAAGFFIPHLCYHPEFKPHGSCKLCTVKVNGRHTASCTMRASAGMIVESETEEINSERRALTQMLFVEGNHFCPSCEKSGNCQLQATAYHLGMMSPHYDHFFPNRAVDASHSEVLLDFNRCILCSLCVRASRDVDGKNVFALSGRGIKTHLIVNAKSGQLGDTDFSLTDKAAQVCPVGVILQKRQGFAVPIGERKFDKAPISETAETTGGR